VNDIDTTGWTPEQMAHLEALRVGVEQTRNTALIAGQALHAAHQRMTQFAGLVNGKLTRERNHRHGTEAQETHVQGL